MECMDTLFFILSLCLKVFTVYFAAVALFALRRRKQYPRTAPKTRFAVVVAARNEEAVIGDLVYSVLNQDYPPELRDVYVVPNNCTDFTEAAAAASGAGIIRNFLFREDTAVDFSCQLDQWRQLLEIFVQTVVGRILPLFFAVNFDTVHIVQQRSQL